MCGMMHPPRGLGSWSVGRDARDGNVNSSAAPVREPAWTRLGPETAKDR